MFARTVHSEVTDRMPVSSQRHLRTGQNKYAQHYNVGEDHTADTQLRPPRPDHPTADLTHGSIKRHPVLSGLNNEYERAA
ncbi:hypothetical protein [Streptomyces sp. NPDC005507]|uniref:hypothetical protein n=1 Tax=unclassified Streptomyces TaxID=2593676 RepID=UPI0033B35C39